ncbi:MAG: hypothetical protein IJU76_00370 [Desulfovibrionaceae bacterium]|nr:hypothetical protein [Desulfovibrionaceae bacterium]
MPADFGIRFAESAFPEPFTSGLEFNAPVRGPWNIVHMALAVPDAHLLYICARGCLRGVLMTAAEMGAMDRISWVGVREEALATGTLDEATAKSACSVLRRLPKSPPIVFVYTSCIHVFCGMDQEALLETLTRTFPNIRFISCAMMPTMRKSGPTDEERTRKAIYEPLLPIPSDSGLTLIGNDHALDPTSLLARLIRSAGRTLRELPTCKTFDEYMRLGQSGLFFTTHPQARFAAKALAKRLGRPVLDLPLSFGEEEIESALQTMADALDLPLPDLSEAKEKADRALALARQELAAWEIAIDYTMTARPLSLARSLLRHGLHVTALYLDAFQPDEKDDHAWIAAHHGDIMLYPTIHPNLRLHALRPKKCRESDILALGQKAAYFSETPFFVNRIADGGYYDFTGLENLAQAMRLSAQTPKDPRTVLQQKGLGLPTCLTGCCGG